MGIQKARKLKGLTQDELAKALDVSRSTVSMWESGESSPRAEKLPEIASALGCKIDELFKGKGEG